MDIGTAKPTLEERTRVPHHLIDIREPWESFSVGDFVRLAEKTIAEIHARGKAALVVGGTPMYLKGFMHGLFCGPSADWTLRHEMIARAEREGVEALHKELARVDPVAAQRIHIHDLRRIVRALEVYIKTGRPISAQQREWDGIFSTTNPKPPLRQARGVILVRDRADLCARINKRVNQMFAQGLVEEVRRLLAHPAGLSHAARQALGYKEVIEYLKGKRSLRETVALVQVKTRQFAKRQMTWFRSFKEFTWIEISPTATVAEIAAEVLKAFS